MREVVTRSRMAIFVMRYLLLPLMILATTHSLYSQTGVYEVVPVDLSRGYAIAEGGTITVAGGNITEWDISVTGEFPFRFMTGQPMVALDAGFEISDTRIDTSTDLPSGAGFRAVAPCPAAFLPAPALCEFDLAWTTSETGSFRGYLMKSSDNFTINGYMENSILNIQDLNSDLFPKFKQAGLEIITYSHLQKMVNLLLSEPGKLVQSMFFEGNPETWPHQDTYYLDSDNIGCMTAAWIAIEDINPGAGRFYVYPYSHTIDVKKNGGDFDIAFNHDRYKKLVIDIIKNKQLTITAPALNKGDVIFWNSKTIHGSLHTTQHEFSRASFTAHYIPESHQFLQYQSRVKSLHLEVKNNMLVNTPKNQDCFKNRLIFKIETKFPRTFYLLKKIAIKYF